uniref:Uncharacterized protein n=1 Tax=Candidatus Kentrum sp. FM TaxID=2126340 RepID=A0A450SB14_9GAMM|nr:MAG: hypothetical protein BECKFM1743A_GA0114220_100712 [Candidatus Kentron sp. FM]VFK10504.1 MAG: hypothetical protein BECKFM1743B_GA0114221_101426 [Candidatus Kentron sp. FM]
MNYVTVIATQKLDDKDKQVGIFFDRNRLSPTLPKPYHRFSFLAPGLFSSLGESAKLRGQIGGFPEKAPYAGLETGAPREIGPDSDKSHFGSHPVAPRRSRTCRGIVGLSVRFLFYLNVFSVPTPVHGNRTKWRIHPPSFHWVRQKDCLLRAFSIG